MKIISWNVNGIRACAKKGAFFDYIDEHDPDILFIQEIKALEEDIPEELINPRGYHSEFFSAKRKGYSGVAIYTKHKPIKIIKGFGVDKFDDEGRVISAEFESFICLGVYFPNGQMNDDRLQYKLDFYDAFFQYCHELKENTGKPLLVCGDYNTAHTEIDLARPKENEDVSGFLPVERAWMDKLIDEYGYVDTFRHLDDREEQYSWWTYRAGARARNVGWRIDYVLIHRELLPTLDEAFIQQSVMGSDHCPVGVTLSI